MTTPTTRPMRRWSAMWLVALREIRERTRSRTFKIGTAITVVIVCIGIVGPAIFGNEETPTYRIGIVQPAPPELEQSIEQPEAALGVDLEIEPITDVTMGETQLQDGTIDLLVVPSKEIVTKVALDPGLGDALSRIAASTNDISRLYAGLEQQGLNATQSSAALNSQPLALRGLEPAEHRDTKNASSAAGSMILLFVFLTLYGAWILNGVVEEKNSRVVEVLLSTVRADELLIGKVIGIGLVGSLQGVVLVVATLVARSSVGNEGTEITAPVLAYTFLWFILGFGIYAWAYACAGALVSRAEDAQNLVFPLQMPLLASYVVGLVSTVNGPSAALTVMSMIPFTAPMTMLARMAAEQVPLWQVAVSVTLSVITAFIVMRLAIIIFSGGILRSGQRVKLREAWRNP